MIPDSGAYLKDSPDPWTHTGIYTGSGLWFFNSCALSE